MAAEGIRMRPTMRAWLGWLAPLSGGPTEIRALDGLRAVAALSVLAFHAIGSTAETPRLWGHDVSFAADYLQTGVHLFFVLSGFLLFLPYARAMLSGRRLPSAFAFYRRRARRIWPAYWVCLGVLVLLSLPPYLSPVGAANIGTHLLFIHDDFPDFVRAIDTPFWTLAVEWQFYLLLPLMATGIARLVGSTRSRMRLLSGVILVIALALALRALDLVAMMILPGSGSIAQRALTLLVAVTFGWRGKFLEVFGLGMLCGALYVITVEGEAMPLRRRRWVGPVLVLAGLALLSLLAYKSTLMPGLAGGVVEQFQHGVGYALLVLGVLWSGKVVRFVFESWPLRVVGLISYSLYLWHAAFIYNLVPLTVGLKLKGRIVVAFIVAYLSYQVVERPFMPRKDTSGAAAKSDLGVVPSPVPALAD